MHANDVISDGNGNITATGPISGMISGGFTINEGSGGGYVHVLTSAQTAVAGAPPFVGENVAVSGAGVPGGTITASSVAQQVVLPSGVLALSGPISGSGASGFTVQAPGYGYVNVTTTASTQLEGGSPQNGDQVQAVGPGSASETATFVSSWASVPPSVTQTGTIVAATSLGFTLNANPSNPAVAVILASSTSVSKWPMVVGGSVIVTGAGSLQNGIVASAVSVPSPAPASTSTPVVYATPTPPPVVLAQGAVIGEDDQFSPPDGDTRNGGAGQTVDAIPCAPTMTENLYHVHWYLGILVDGKQVAIPDQIGMLDPGPISNGFTASAHCYYEIHTHDASGMIHVESASTAPLSSSIYTVGTFLDVWGTSVGPLNVGPFSGRVRIFVDRVPLKGAVANSYAEWTASAASIPIYSHEAIWLEVGPTYVVPPNLPAVDFYTEY